MNIHRIKIPCITSIVLVVAGCTAVNCVAQTVNQLKPRNVVLEQANAAANTRVASLPLPERSVRIKDITSIAGDRSNNVEGNGLVLGLAGTGGRSEVTLDMARNFYSRNGNRIENIIITQNMCAVFVQGKIPAYARKGEKILIDVAVADDASSLRGGILKSTELRGIDNEIYAIASGPIIGGGVSAGGAAASVQKNHPTAGKVEAVIEREICGEATMNNGRIRLILQNKDYATATYIANVINTIFSNSSMALDSGTVEVNVPRSFYRKLPVFISMIGELRVRPDTKARVIINQKTGTILMGQNVRLSRVLFASENIIISTTENPIASQPAPFSDGQTAILPRTSVDVFESGGSYNLWQDGITVGELANALNTLAVSPLAMIDIFTSLRNQGALQAELIIE